MRAPPGFYQPGALSPRLRLASGRGQNRPAWRSNRRTLIAIYVVMAIAVTVVAAVVFSAGQDLHAEKSIAGGYDLAKPDTCLGASFDIRQSGEFANIENADGSLGGSLRVDNGRLTGDVSCVGGAAEPIDAHGGDRALEGTIGGRAAPGRADPRPAAARARGRARPTRSPATTS